MAKKKPNGKLLKQSAGYLPGTWELVVEIDRSEFNDTMEIIKKDTLLSYLMSTPVGEKIKALEAENTAEMIQFNTTYSPKKVILTVVLMVTSKQQLFALTLGENLI